MLISRYYNRKLKIIKVPVCERTQYKTMTKIDKIFSKISKSTVLN